MKSTVPGGPGLACALLALALAAAPAAGQTCAAGGCPADTNGDLDVNVDDLVNVILGWGPCPDPCPPFCAADVVPDCEVNVDDLVGVILGWGPCEPSVVVVPPGEDCWATPCGQTQFSFADNPIPADFFGPGSEPFAGVVQLGGGGALIDTVVSRLGDLVFEQPLPSAAETPIQLVQLDLVSCQPIVVQTDGVPQQWDVEIAVNPGTPPGQLQAILEQPDGGTFNANFFVQPLFTFVPVGPGSPIGPVDFGVEFQLVTSEAPWTTLPVPDPCSPDDCFNPGWRFIDGEPCCEETCHDTIPPSDKLHCTTSPQCPPCPPPCGPGQGDCCAPNGSPGCEIPDCCERVCGIDPFCCDVEWDAICADEATGFPQCGCIVTFEFPIEGAQEVPPVDTPGSGAGTVTFDPNTFVLSWTITYQDLQGPVTASHFHGPALPGQNAGVQVGIGNGPSPLVGSAPITPAQRDQLLGGLWYVNIHTTVEPAGEIRGQVE